MLMHREPEGVGDDEETVPRGKPVVVQGRTSHVLLAIPVRAGRRRVPAEHQAHPEQRQRERAVGTDRLVVARERRVPQRSPIELLALEERLQRGQ
jgi:hypothetical protein